VAAPGGWTRDREVGAVDDAQLDGEREGRGLGNGGAAAPTGRVRRHTRPIARTQARPQVATRPAPRRRVPRRLRLPRVRLIPRPVALVLLVAIVVGLGIVTGEIVTLLVRLLYRVAVSAVR
jgi:hypothetical protein